MASLPVGAPTAGGTPAESTGMPLELNRMQEVLAMAAPSRVKQAGACAIAACVFGGAAPTTLKLKMSLVESEVRPPSVTQSGGTAVFDQTSQGQDRASRTDYKPHCIKAQAAR